MGGKALEAEQVLHGSMAPGGRRCDAGAARKDETLLKLVLLRHVK
jgi:hypothetical protein